MPPLVDAPPPASALPTPTGALPPSAAPTPIPAPSPAEPPLRLPARLVELFRLNELEQQVLRVLLEAGSAGGESGLSLRRLAQAVASDELQLIARLAPEGPLRRRALVEVDSEAELGFLRPSDELHAARGLVLWCRGAMEEAGLLAAQLPGLVLLPTPPPETAWAEELRAEKPPPALVELVRERLVAPHPVLLALSGCSPEAALALAQAARLRLQRPVLFLDGAALQGWPLPQLGAALRRLRRDADLRGAALVVSEAPLLGAAVRALCAPRAAGQTAPVVLCGSGSVALPAVPALVTAGETALTATAAALRPPPGPAPTGTAAAPTAAAATAEPEDPAVLASREEARRRAALDAARAMGRPIPADLLGAVSAPPAPAAVAAPRAAPSPTPAAPAAPAEASRPAAAAAPAPTEAPAGRPRNPRLAAALAKAGLPPVGSSAHAALRTGDEPPDEPPPPPRAAPPPVPAAEPVRPLSAAPPAAPRPAPEAAPAGEEPADEQPPIPLDDDAPLDEVLRVARSTPNHAQRAALLRRLEGAKSPAVIQLFRQFLTSPHAGVRAAAEAGMSSLFGPNWNRARAIAPPVQPPRSDDGGRGPGGAF